MTVISFRSRVARRIVLLFFACAAIPVAGLALVAFDRVRDVLIQQGGVQLARLGESYGTALYGRLNTLDYEADTLATMLAAGRMPDARDIARLQAHFIAVQVDDGSGQRTDLLAPADFPRLPAAAQGHFSKNLGFLFVRSEPAGDDALVLARTLDPARPTGAHVLLAPDPHYLWDDEGSVAAATTFCVSVRSRLLTCADRNRMALARTFASRMGVPAAGRLEEQVAGEHVLADYRELFLEARYGLEGLRILTIQDEAELLAPLHGFGALFVPIVALSLGMAALLSLSQIRRTLTPLARLIEGTRRAAAGDFTTPVTVASKDEFGELAASFNTMTSRLRRQFAALMTLTEIDRAILSRVDVERVLETIVRRIGQIVPVEMVRVVVSDRHAPGMLHIQTRDPAGTVTIERRDCALDALQELLRHPAGIWLAPETERAPYAEWPGTVPVPKTWVLPIFWQEQVVGAIMLGYSGAATLEAADERRARSLADRIGVAFATAAKDEQLYHQAHYDSLTDLPNRLYFKDQLSRTILHAERAGQSIALLFLDLDHFKNVNDSLGHAAGDAVLQQAAARLEAAVRKSDAVARLGGDEFTVILSELTRSVDASDVANAIIATMSAPFLVAGREHFLSASIGIALYPDDGVTADDLLRHADTAMYRAKQGGRARAVFFEERMNAAAQARVELEGELRRGLVEKQFRVHYQPQHDLESGAVVGVEALVRWLHPTRGMVPPAEFIGLAEETGLIDGLGEWVLRESVQQYARWRSSGLALSRLAVNVSASQFRQPTFVEDVASILAAEHVPASDLELEITESLLIDAPRRVEEMLLAFRAIGVRIALDDFGTGYASLSYLKQFPVDTVKIDRAFVKDLPGDPSSVAITGAVIAMAHALGKHVVAEGIECPEQLIFLRDLGCESGQGYLLGRPIEGDAVERHIECYRSTVPEGLYPSSSVQLAAAPAACLA